MNAADIPGSRTTNAGVNKYFIGTALALGAVVLTGFARTYYLKVLFGTPPLTWWVHLHGFLLTLWFILFLVQSSLIASHRVALHRRLGVFGGFLAAAVVIVGVPTLLHFVAAPEPNPEIHGFLLQLLGVDLLIFVLFAGFVSSAILMRHRGDVHKRLMLLGTLSLVWPPMSRIPIAFISDNFLVSLILTDLCVVVCIAIDTIRHRRLHPVFGWGGLLNIAALHLCRLGVHTQTWMQFANRLVS